MSVQKRPLLTPEQYLELERHRETKSEYFQGEIFARAGGSRAHNRIALNLGGDLNTRLSGTDCEPFALDMRVKVAATGLYTYPDVVVACGQILFEDNSVDTLLNPVLIAEVQSTEAYDRGSKFEQYRAIESLQEYVLIAEDRPYVERYRRHAEDWVLTPIAGLNTALTLDSIGYSTTLAEIYRRVEFNQASG